MKKPSLFLLAALLLLTACPDGGDDTKNPTPEPSTPASQAASTRPSPRPSGRPPAGVKRGIFVFGEDYKVFKPCGTTQDIWVKDTPAKDLENRYRALKLMDLEPAYVELNGTVKPTGKSENGFGAGYQQTLEVSKVQTLQPWTSDGRCFATDFVALGTQPDWNLQILKGSDVFFKSHEGEFPVVDTLAYSAPKQEGNKWRYEFRFRTPDEETLQAEFSEEACSFGGKEYPFSAKLLFRGSTYTGCASKLG